MVSFRTAFREAANMRTTDQRIVLLIGCVAASAGGGASLASAETKLSVERASVANREVRPKRIQVGNLSYLSGLRWTRWGADSASGAGRWNQCDGISPCVTASVRVRATDRGWCVNGDLFETLSIRPAGSSARRGGALPLRISWRTLCGHGPLTAEPPSKRGGVVLRDCRKTERPPTVTRPATIECGAVGAPAFNELRWRSWGRRTARAAGTVVYRTCPSGTASCSAPENYHRVPVKLTVSGRRICDGRRAYTRLRATFSKVTGQRSGFRLDLTDAWRRCR
jgi:hypothetical protein